MAFTAKPLATGQVTTTATNVYTVPAGTTTRISEIALTNTGAATEHITIWVVPSGGTAGNSNVLFHEYDVPHGVGFPFTFEMGTFMNAGDTIRVDGEATNITYRISGIEEA